MFSADKFLRSSSYLPYGIYTNVKIDSIDIDKTSGHIDIVYVTTDDTKQYRPDKEPVDFFAGHKDRKRVFFPSLDKVFPREGESRQEALEREKVLFVRTLSATAAVLIGQQELSKINSPTYEGLVETLVRVIDSNKDRGRFNIKVTLDKNLQYSEIPGRGDSWFEAAIDPPRIQFTEWEKKNRLPKPITNLDDIIG